MCAIEDIPTTGDHYPMCAMQIITRHFFNWWPLPNVWNGEMQLLSLSEVGHHLTFLLIILPFLILHATDWLYTMLKRGTSRCVYVIHTFVKCKVTATVVHDVCPAMLTNSKTRVPLNTREPYTRTLTCYHRVYCLARCVRCCWNEVIFNANLTCTCVPMHRNWVCKKTVHNTYITHVQSREGQAKKHQYKIHTTFVYKQISSIKTQAFVNTHIKMYKKTTD